jgi:hypothetical protein
LKQQFSDGHRWHGLFPPHSGWCANLFEQQQLPYPEFCQVSEPRKTEKIW